MNYDAILFDLDGTLLDTLEDLRNSVNYALTRMGFPTHDLPTIRSYVGNGVKKLVERSLPQDVSDEIFGRAFTLFFLHYSKNMAVKTKPYNGIPEVLDELKQHYKLAIVSNKAQNAVTNLNNIYFKKYNMQALGEIKGRTRKPDPQIVYDALNALNAKNALYIGDSPVDIATAKASGLDLLCVSWGFVDTDVLKNAGANHIINTPKEIFNFL